ncbi:MAG: hypothetical protein ACKVVT_17895 [Dehalococcoidia bacterium]
MPFDPSFRLPPPFDTEGLEVPYTAKQLEPTIRRLRLAVEVDLRSDARRPQERLAAAWTRIAELRFPRKAVPVKVLDEVERLIISWDAHGRGGIIKYAQTLSDVDAAREAGRVVWMLQETESLAALDFPYEVVPTE